MVCAMSNAMAYSGKILLRYQIKLVMVLLFLPLSERGLQSVNLI